jgi:hypothetical protein
MVPSSSGSSHFVGLVNSKYEGSFEISEAVCPITQCNIPEAFIFQHVFVPFPMTIATTLDMNYFLLYIPIPQQGPDHMPQMHRSL